MKIRFFLEFFGWFSILAGLVMLGKEIYALSNSDQPLRITSFGVPIFMALVGLKAILNRDHYTSLVWNQRGRKVGMPKRVLVFSGGFLAFAIGLFAFFLAFYYSPIVQGVPFRISEYLPQIFTGMWFSGIGFFGVLYGIKGLATE